MLLVDLAPLPHPYIADTLIRLWMIVLCDSFDHDFICKMLINFFFFKILKDNCDNYNLTIADPKFPSECYPQLPSQSLLSVSPLLTLGANSGDQKH